MIHEITSSGIKISFPARFSHYSYIKTIDSGTTAMIISVRDDFSGNVYAAKVISREHTIESNMLQYLERELRLLQSISHPNIVKFIDSIYTPTCIMLIQELCSNGNVLGVFSKGVLSRNEAMKYSYQLCLAVSYLHQRNIAHRDLKPENIFLDQNFDVKLGDFGLSRETQEGTLFSTLCGTIYYTAPEIIQNKQKYDAKKADIWSLGIVIFTLFVGALPWTNTDQVRVYDEILRAAVSVPSTVFPAVSKVIYSCCSLDPNMRPNIDQVLNSSMFNEQRRKEIAQVESSASFTTDSQGHQKNASKNFFLRKSVQKMSFSKRLHRPTSSKSKQASQQYITHTFPTFPTITDI